jgi:hypothetical protein
MKANADRLMVGDVIVTIAKKEYFFFVFLFIFLKNMSIPTPYGGRRDASSGRAWADYLFTCSYG